MADDPYKVLGVSRDASQDEIRKAYRKLAKASHPDLHPGDAEAETRFKKITAANDLLGDPEKRARYDGGEIDESGAERPQHPFYRDFADGGGAERYYSSAGFEDFGGAGGLFEDLFAGDSRDRQGHTFRLRGADALYQLHVDFMDAVKGVKKRITLPEGGTLDLTIPAGTEPGQVLRLKGKGQQGIGGGPPGDAMVKVFVGDHPVFKRDGADVRVEVPITLDEAILGGSIEVPTITGKVTMTVPRGARNGQVLRLRGKGLAGSRAGVQGDQMVTLKIVLPEEIDDELAAFFKIWREKHRYDPRAALKEASR